MEFTHFDQEGKAIMVDVGEKADTKRIAIAQGTIKMSDKCFEMIVSGNHKKGDVLGVARIAGIMATKKTQELIPLCHNIFITKANIDFKLDNDSHTITCECSVETIGKTGIEMEALTGTSVALLTIYDMCKAIDRSMVIENICVLKKDGGRSGLYERSECND